MAWTQEEFSNWKQSPLTQQFFAHLKERREALMEEWASGAAMEPADQFAAATYGDIIDLNYEEDVEPFYAIDEAEENEEDE